MRFIFLSLLVFCISLTGCKNELRVTTLEPLKPDVLKNHIDKDSMFMGNYNEIRLLVDSVYLRGNNKTLIAGLTYSDLFNFQREFKHRYDNLKTDTDIKKHWDKSFGKTYEQFIRDSIEFRNYIKRNSYKPYVELEFIKAYERERWIGTELVAEIKATPINGNVVCSIKGYLVFKPKGEQFQEGVGISLGDAYFTERYPYTESFIIEANDYTKEQLRNYINLPKFIIDQKYDTYFNLSELILLDRYVDVSLDSIPENFKRLLEYPNAYKADFYIKEELDSNYNSISDLITSKIRIEMKKKYAVVFDFYDYGYEHLYNPNLEQAH